MPGFEKFSSDRVAFLALKKWWRKSVAEVRLIQMGCRGEICLVSLKTTEAVNWICFRFREIMTSGSSRPSPIELESKLILGQMIDCCLRGNGLD